MRDPFVPSDDVVRDLLERTRSVAVVGLSEDPSRPSFDVAEYLVRVGYEVVPVNPRIPSWGGRRSFPSLVAAWKAGARFGLVDVFRRPEHVGEVVEDAIASGSGAALWLQLGVVDEEAARRAMAAGLLVVMDRCTKIEHRRLGVGRR